MRIVINLLTMVAIFIIRVPLLTIALTMMIMLIVVPFHSRLPNSQMLLARMRRD